MLEKTRLDLGIGGRGNPGKTLLVKGTGAADFATLRDQYLFNVDQITGDVLIFADLDTAINACRASLGDTVYVSPGHTETLTTAADIALDVAGVSVIGLGVGNNRPVFTFSSTNNAATFTVSANNCSLKNIVAVCNDDALTNAFVVTGDNCELDIEFQDTSLAIEAATAVRLDTANNAKLKLKYLGFTGGNAVVSAVVLDDCDNVDIEIDGFGVVSTAWVQMVDVASTNVKVRGTMFTQGITNFTRDVVDTIGGSTWSAQIFDASAGASVSGGSAAALAVDDVATVAAAVAVIDGFHDVPTADATTNTVMRDVIGNKTDAGVQAIAANKSLIGYIKGIVDMLAGTAGLTTFPPAAAAANAVSIAEVLRYVSEYQSPRMAIKAYADLTGYDTAAAFTVTGDVLVRVFGVVGVTPITSTSGTTTLSVGTTETVAGLIAATTVDNSDFAATDVWVDNDPTSDCELISTTSWGVVGGGADIILTRNVDDLTAGTLTLYCEWKPLSLDGAVVAA